MEYRLSLSQALVMLDALSRSTRIFRIKFRQSGTADLSVMRCRYNWTKETTDRPVPFNDARTELTVYEYNGDNSGVRTIPLADVVSFNVSGTDYVFGDEA